MTHISKLRHHYFGANVRITACSIDSMSVLIVSTFNPLANNWIEKDRFTADEMDDACTLAKSLSTTKKDI
jgi:purine nucleoside permease